MSVFTDESAYLIHLIKCAIHDQQPQEIPDPLWFEAVYRYGLWHQVANIAFYSVKKLQKKPAQELYREWEDCCNKAVVRDMNQSYARDEIVNGFREAEIRYLEVQGTEIKKLYPCPEYRTMSDIDFIIDIENLEKAQELLEQLGYSCVNVNGEEVDGFRSPNIHVEVHAEYFKEASVYYHIMRTPFASVDETGAYDINEFYIYNMLHIAKHYFNRGCGIRRVLDVYYLNRNYRDLLDPQYVQSVLEKANAWEFVVEISALAEDWFGNGDCTVDRNEMVGYILGSGLHGTAQNALNNRIKAQYSDGVRFFKLKYLLRRIFSMEAMYVRYPFVKRWKILIPFCWLHRAFLGLNPKNRKKIKEEVKTVVDADL